MTLSTAQPVRKKESSIAIIILAAGASTRMGKAKQLLEYNGRSLIQHAVEVATASVCHPVIVVLGAYCDRIKPEIAASVKTIENPLWHQGMGTSIRMGIETLSRSYSQTEAAILMLCDQPFVSPHLIEQLIDVYRTTSAPIVASEYTQVIGVPALFDRSFFTQLTALSGDMGARKIIQKYIRQVARVSFPQGIIDIDTPHDYSSAIAKVSNTN
ncbi:nucleotidyltransferase family protein [Oscillatoria sp. FACHB-1406]|uniref:nucleotidyltransferase family protein n=1 Tax=Oscillatoria sp. FACHB-1406 TaxID=2692846 RepID=UPI0016888C38|nr:nucleotidyltransferase family protein [Oscillatoria sp. FACHB-1406]MBD2580449.1 nucleotidyltransferase family protein [Oscillatoria sp. FACHB-1406]